VRQQREEDREKMKLANVRIVLKSGHQYYAKVVITTELLLIHADDATIMNFCFRPIHIRGYNDIKQKGVEVRLYNDPESLVIYFRTSQQRGCALKRLEYDSYVHT
jgi:hypothetical protein